jgi:small-conductance mechanosensitive channel
LLATLLGQIFGYVNFSAWLLQAAFETGMVILSAHIILRLGSGGTDFLLKRTTLGERRFFKRLGGELSRRIGNLLRTIVVLYSIFYLLPLWRMFASSHEAWEIILNYSLIPTIAQVNVRMITMALVALYLALQFSWLLQGLFDTKFFYRKSVDRGVRDAIKKLVHYGVVTLGFLAGLSLLGFSLQNFVVVLGAFGVGIGFGLQDIVNNFLSGLILLFERPIKVGDFIVVNNEWGNITKIGLRSTVVETIDHAEIIVPNSQLISDKVTNWTHTSRVARLVIPVGVAYGSDVALVMGILAEVAQEHPDAVQEPKPNILFMEFGDSSLNFEIRVFVPEISDSFRIRSEILQQVDARFRDASIEIPFPQRDLHLRSIDGKILNHVDAMSTAEGKE